MHDELIVKELEKEVIYNHKACIVFDSIVYFPVENIRGSNFQFSVGIDGYPFVDCRLNHRYPNKEYYTISRKYGRRLSKIGYPYLLDLQDGKQRLSVSIHFSFLDASINIKFPIEIDLTETNPVCGLGIRYIPENDELILTSNERTDDSGWMTYRWRGIMSKNGNRRMETGIKYAKMMENPTFDKDTKTWSFDEIIRLAPQKLEKEAAEALQEKKQGLDKKYGALSTLNQAIPFICKGMEESFGKEHVHYCTGRETACLRRSLGFHKTEDNQLHEVDAWCIGMTALHLEPEKAPDLSDVHKIMQFRRQNRANIQSQRARTYKYNKKTVARNRKKSMGQKDDSLAEWFAKQVKLHGEKEAERMRSQLTVKKIERRYNDKDRVLPGAVFLYQGKRYVLSGQLSNGKYFRAVGDKKNELPCKRLYCHS